MIFTRRDLLASRLQRLGLGLGIPLSRSGVLKHGDLLVHVEVLQAEDPVLLAGEPVPSEHLLGDLLQLHVPPEVRIQVNLEPRLPIRSVRIPQTAVLALQRKGIVELSVKVGMLPVHVLLRQLDLEGRCRQLWRGGSSRAGGASGC